MKRIIKFRAYTEISNEVLGMKYDVPHNYNDTVMQFTGLLDRNGKEIYEGDILNVEYADGDTIICPVEIPAIYWQEPIRTWKLEIIGNIYENPELIK